MSEEPDTFGESSARRERRRRSLITLIAVALVVFCAAWYAYSYVRAEDRHSGTAAAVSTRSSDPACALTPERVTVNVYNATDREGLAGTVAEELSARGFDVQTVANDPKSKTLTGTAELRHGPKGEAAARLLKRQVAAASAVSDERARPTVDLVLGDGFEALRPKADTAGC